MDVIQNPDIYWVVDPRAINPYNAQPLFVGMYYFLYQKIEFIIFI